MMRLGGGVDAVLAGRAAALAARLADLTGSATQIQETDRGVLVLCALDPLSCQDAWIDVQAALDEADSWSVQGRAPGPEPRLLQAELRLPDPDAT
jgi:hypothetical protein